MKKSVQLKQASSYGAFYISKTPVVALKQYFPKKSKNRRIEKKRQKYNRTNFENYELRIAFSKDEGNKSLNPNLYPHAKNTRVSIYNPERRHFRMNPRWRQILWSSASWQNITEKVIVYGNKEK